MIFIIEQDTEQTGMYIAYVEGRLTRGYGITVWHAIVDYCEKMIDE